MTRARDYRVRMALVGAMLVASATPIFAQVDPLFFMKTVAPNVIFVVDTANRMQSDAPTDPRCVPNAPNSSQCDASVSSSTSNYYDPKFYAKTGLLYETQSLGISNANTAAGYRRKFNQFSLFNPGNPDKGQTTTISAVGDLAPGSSTFEAPTRLAIARAAMYQAINENQNVVRFGLIKMRQSSPALATAATAGTAADADPNQAVSDATPGKWNIYRPTVSVSNGSTGAPSPVTQIKADTDPASSLLTLLAKDPRAAGALLPAGTDTSTDVDTPVYNMLVDAQTEAKRLIAISNDPTCRNTVVVLIVGGGEGTTTVGRTNADLATIAATFVNLNLSGRRVPIYVIALAPPQTDVASLKAIATQSGGQYFEITKAQMDTALNSAMQQATAGATPCTPAGNIGSTGTPLPTCAAAPSGTIIVPDVVKAIDIAIQHTFALSTDFNTAPTTALPYGPSTEYQVTSPIIGTVNLNNAKDINGTALYDGVTTPQPPFVKDKSGNVIPQRNNVMVTTGVTMPGFDAKLRAFLVYKPVQDATQLSGYKFKADGTRLWIAKTPSDPNQRNLFTADANGNIIKFSTSDPATLATLATLMNLNTTDASTVITTVRGLALGAVLDSTPAIMNPPSLDPPPDAAYPGFAVANKDRRTILWAGTNRGILEGIDARSGLEVWGFIPLNLLPKLRTLVDGQPVGKFDFFMDGSPKISDVRLAGICDATHLSACWRTHLVVGEGPGGAFYQSFDVTLDNMNGAGQLLSSCIAPDSDDLTLLLSCFSNTSAVKLNWAFPKYSDFEPNCNNLGAGACTTSPYGDLKLSATATEKSVGQTWSVPAIGEIVSNSGPYTVLLGSGFLPYAIQHQPNRADKVAGTTFYMVSAKDGTVYASSDVGSDGVNETNNDCSVDNSNGCVNIKNALQTDPVATGPSNSRFITKAYIGDLDGNVWRFDVGLDLNSNPIINAKNKLFSAGASQPIFNSMATVNVGGVNQYIFFGTGSDLLPATDQNTTYQLLGVLDSGAATGTKSMSQVLTKTSTLASDERVTAFPAVAGDIVFFTTTTFKESVTSNSNPFSTQSSCAAPDAKLYAFTFIGGAAYDTNNDGTFDIRDTTLVKTVAGQRATAPFIVDQHLVFASGSSVSVFGDPSAYNNGVGQAGMRILSWREVR